MLGEANHKTQRDSENWLLEIKSELTAKTQDQSQKYNFDFQENCQLHSSGSAFQWKKAKKSSLGVGNLRTQQDFRRMEIKPFTLPTLKISQNATSNSNKKTL